MFNGLSAVSESLTSQNIQALHCPSVYSFDMSSCPCIDNDTDSYMMLLSEPWATGMYPEGPEVHPSNLSDSNLSFVRTTCKLPKIWHHGPAVTKMNQRKTTGTSSHITLVSSGLTQTVVYDKLSGLIPRTR